MSLHLGVNKSSQDVRRDWKVGEDKLRLLMKAEQGEVVPQLHGLNGTFLLLIQKKKTHNRNSSYHMMLVNTEPDKLPGGMWWLSLDGLLKGFVVKFSFHS